VVRFLSCAAVGAALLALSACGDDSRPRATVAVRPLDQKLTPAQADPAAPLAPATLATIAGVADAEAGFGFVDVAGLASLTAPLDATGISRAVLGRAAAQLASSAPADTVKAVTQVGPATVLDGAARVIRGGTAAMRRTLTTRRPAPSIITADLTAAIQTCLGDAVAERLLGPATVGRGAAVGVALSHVGTATPHLVVCASPRLVRDLGPVEARMRARLSGVATSTQKPVIGEVELGERDVVRGALPVAGVSAAGLRALLSGGPQLRALLRG
jgi:hypothetical protein